MISIGGAFAFATWMAAFTETVEKHNPAATATGLAVWGATLRFIVVVAFAGLIYAIPAASTLVDSGQKVQALAAGPDPDLNAAAERDRQGGRGRPEHRDQGRRRWPPSTPRSWRPRRR